MAKKREDRTPIQSPWRKFKTFSRDTVPTLIGDINRELQPPGLHEIKSIERVEKNIKKLEADLEQDSRRTIDQSSHAWRDLLTSVSGSDTSSVDKKLVNRTRRSLWRHRKKAAKAIEDMKKAEEQMNPEEVRKFLAILEKLDSRSVASAKRSALQQYDAYIQELKKKENEVLERSLLDSKLESRRMKELAVERQRNLERIEDRKNQLRKQRDANLLKLQQVVSASSGVGLLDKKSLSHFKVGNGLGRGGVVEGRSDGPTAPNSASGLLGGFVTSPVTDKEANEKPVVDSVEALRAQRSEIETLRQETLDRLLREQGKPADTIQLRTEDLDLRPLSSSLRADHIHTAGTYRLDHKTELDFDASVISLKEQVRLLAHRLKAAFPETQVLPYDVWKGEDAEALKTWLKILAARWEARMSTIPWDDEDAWSALGVNQSLNADSAKRMKARLGEMDRKRMAVDRDLDLDLDEFEAQMSYLTDDPEATRQQEGSSTDIDAFQEEPKEAHHNNHRTPNSLSLPWASRPSDNLRPAGATRSFSTSTICSSTKHPDGSNAAIHPPQPSQPLKPSPFSPKTLPHLTSSGAAHMVSVSTKPSTLRTAIAVGTVLFSNPSPLKLIQSASLKKGDVLSVSRIAGIMAAKKCPDLIPLCHPIMIEHVSVDLHLLAAQDAETREKPGFGFGGVEIEAKVQCTGPTGVEMEALTAVMGAALTVVDMCKAVDKGMRVQDVRVVLKEGGRSGTWRDEEWVPKADK